MRNIMLYYNIMSTRARSPKGRYISNHTSLSSIFTKQGKGKKSLNGKNVTDFLRKILGNRVFDIYLKYLGITALTTSTLVPLGLVLSADYADKIMKKKPLGKFTKDYLPILDNSLVGNYLKIAGLSLLSLTPGTLLPLGVIMVIYDLAMKNLVKQKGGRLTVGSNIPPNFIQKIDAISSGQSGAPLFEAYNVLDPKLQQACGDSSCLPNNISGPYKSKGLSHRRVKGFKTNEIPQADSTNKILSLPLHEVNIGDYTGNASSPKMMAGGSVSAANYAPLYATGGSVEIGVSAGAEGLQAAQIGGKNVYSKIVNPKTGRKVNITGLVGRTIIKNYLNFIKGGSLSEPSTFSLSRAEASRALDLCDKRLIQLTKKQRDV